MQKSVYEIREMFYTSSLNPKDLSRTQATGKKSFSEQMVNVLVLKLLYSYILITFHSYEWGKLWSYEVGGGWRSFT
jgi:hypothetical protein